MCRSRPRYAVACLLQIEIYIINISTVHLLPLLLISREDYKALNEEEGVE